MTVDELVTRLEGLRKDKAQGPEKPYKPLLFAAVLVLIAKGKIPTPNIVLDGALQSVFQQLMDDLYPEWPNKADARLPFRHLENDGIWHLIPAEGVSMLDAARSLGATAREILKHVVFAKIDADVFNALSSSNAAWLKALAAVSRQLPPGAIDRIINLVGENPPGLGVRPEEPAVWLTERALEESLVRNWRSTPFAKLGVELARRETDGLPGRQVLTPVNSIDLLGFQPSVKMWWVIELKRGRSSDAVVGQVSRYLGWISSTRLSHGQDAVGAIVAGKADLKLKHAVRANPRLSLWVYDDQLKISKV